MLKSINEKGKDGDMAVASVQRVIGESARDSYRNTDTTIVRDEKPKFDISLVDFADAYQRLRDVFEYKKVYSDDHSRFFEYNKVVVVGGRAVNILTYKSDRYSPDVDVVVDVYRNDIIEKYAALAEKAGFVVKHVYNRERHDKSIGLIYPLEGGKEIKFDVYHKGMEFIGAVPIKYVLDTAVGIHLYIREREMNHGPKLWVDVSSPCTTIIMKFNVWVKMGSMTENKDALDIINVIRNHYRESTVDSFVEHEKARLLEYFQIYNDLRRKPPPIEDAFQQLGIDSPEKFRTELNKMCIKVAADAKKLRMLRK